MNHNIGNKYALTHGESYTRLHSIWADIKTRCYNPNCKSFKDYGGRGITICPEWTDKLNGFTNFRDWALNNGYKEGLQINRINNNGNYETSNCNWVTRLENMRNQRKTILTMEIANEIRTLWNTGKYLQKELAEKYNINPSIISMVINNKIWKKNE